MLPTFSNLDASNTNYEYLSKEDQSFSSSYLTQKRREFVNFVTSVYKDSKQLALHFEKIKSSLSAKIEQPLTLIQMLECFDRISQKSSQSILHTNKSKWIDDEVALLTHLLIYYSFVAKAELESMPEDTWTSIAAIFPTKDVNQIKKRWQGCLKKAPWQVPWSQKEDELLEQIMSEKGQSKKWKEVAEELNARSDSVVYRHGRQCRERWNNHLDPNISRAPFTDEEDVKLFQIYKETGKKWADISKRMKNRTENAVKNRFNALIKKLKNRNPAPLSENLSLVSTESELDCTGLERKLVDQFLQEFEIHGNTKFLNTKEKRPKNRKSDTHSESIFESDSDTFSRQPSGSRTYSNVDAHESAPKDQHSRAVRSLGEITDNNFKSLPTSSILMEEESTRNRTSTPIRSSYNSESSYFEPGSRAETMGYHQNFHSYQYQSTPRRAQNSYFSSQGPSFSEIPQWDSVNYTSSNRPSARGQDFTGYCSQQSRSFTDNYPNTNTMQMNYQYNNPSDSQMIMSPTEAHQALPTNSAYSHESMSRVNDCYPSQVFPGIRNSAPHYFEREDNGLAPSTPKCRLSYDNYGNRALLEPDATPRFNSGNNNFPMPKTSLSQNFPLRTKSFDKDFTEKQIARSNLQYAIVDLSTNEVYYIHPVTKENYDETLTKMKPNQAIRATSLDDTSTRLATSELLMVGKSCERSPSLSYLQSIVNRPSYLAAGSNFTTANSFSQADSSFGNVAGSNGSHLNQPFDARPQDFSSNFQSINRNSYFSRIPQNTYTYYNNENGCL